MAADLVIGNIVKAGPRATAWFVLPPVAWSFRPREERFAHIAAQTAQLAALTGRRCQIRVTSRPFPIRQWAEALYSDIRAHNGPTPGPCPDHPVRSEPGCATCRPGQAWLDWLIDCQVRMGAWGTGQKVVYLGVDLWPRSVRQLFASPGRGSARDQIPPAARRKMNAAAAEAADIVAGPGLRAVPASAQDMRWLFEQSCRLLLPPQPGGSGPSPVAEAAATEMGQDQLSRFTADTSWTVEPFARTMTISPHDGPSRHVAVVTVRDVDKQPNPPDSPWLQRLDLLGFPVEAAVTFDVLSPQLVKRVMGRKIKLIREQAAMFGEHGQQPPLALERQNAQARLAEDEAEHGDPLQAAKVTMWARVAVAGDTRQEAIKRAAEVGRKLGPHIELHHPPLLQYRLAREFIPGQPLATSMDGIEAMPARLLVSGVPAVTTAVGHEHGFPLGATSRLATRAVTWHPWHAIEHSDRSGVVTITGGLGSGKTTLGGLLVYMAVRAGVPTVIMDPSALLDRLCALPELAHHSMAVNLLASPPGTLCPHALIGDPRLQDFAFDDRGRRRDPADAHRLWQQEAKAAEVRRRALVKDVLRMLLPPDTVDKDRRDALDLAVMRTPATSASSPRDVIDHLRGLTDHGLARDATMVAETLEEMASHPWARLFFPPPGDTAASSDVLTGGRLLTVMTLKGLVLPKETRAPHEWTVDERLSVPILHLAAYLTRRHVLDRDRHARKALFIDEAHALTHDPVGLALLSELAARDSRKHNLMAILVSQLAHDMTEAGLPGLVGASFTGRTDDETEQAAALALAGLPAGRGHEAVLASLSAESLHNRGAPKEFLFNDGKGGTEIVAIDLGPSAALVQALNSTPTGRAVTRPAAPALPADPAAAAVKGGTR